MTAIKNNLSDVKKNDWRQGACAFINRDNVSDRYRNPLDKNVTYILIDQDCAIVNSDLNKEPFVELLQARKISIAHGNFKNGSNPRKLHIELGTVCLECSIHGKVYLPKENLDLLEMDDYMVIDGDNLRILVSWLCNRYVKAAFPDEFNRRLRVNKTDKKLEKIMKKSGGNTKGIFVILNTNVELAVGTDYELSFILLVAPRYYENASDMEIINDCMEEITNLLNSVEGIKIIESGVRSSADISLDDFLEHKKWDMDYLSYGDNVDGETLDTVSFA